MTCSRNQSVSVMLITWYSFTCLFKCGDVPLNLISFHLILNPCTSNSAFLHANSSIICNCLHVIVHDFDQDWKPVAVSLTSLFLLVEQGFSSASTHHYRPQHHVASQSLVFPGLTFFICNTTHQKKHR